ncbi:hypothetical protein VE04_00005 [Pseudogymnoascus sp. 24MN13]|nr:hypothetical protein VE04_00005 [Pseudogymnoascus sp. 24MN13]
MPFAQLVVGTAGAGKSTYCDGMQQFMSAIGRKCSVVNLDPANEHTNYTAALDVREIVRLEDIMRDDELGPNGGILYAMEELEHNVEWLEEGLKSLGEDYVIFDCPGQAELFTHHSSLRNIFFHIQKMGYRLVVMNLTDSYCLTLPSLYISNLILSLRAMLQMDLPHLNVLTKIDKLSSMMHLLQMIDRAGGYVFGGAEGANDTVWQVAMREGLTTMDIKDVQERWVDAKDEFDERDRKEQEAQDEAERAKAEAAEHLDAHMGDDEVDEDFGDIC